jgi:thiol-disulfide isomerase/thioredoxin
MGDTALDEETFNDYIQEIQSEYAGSKVGYKLCYTLTRPTFEKYHLLDFNCNSFTNDCVGFLTGQSIPSWIKGNHFCIMIYNNHSLSCKLDLPADFLSTPFGQSMRPMIDNMFQRPGAGAQMSRTAPIPPISQGVAASMTSHVHIATNPATFESLLSSNKAVVAFFTSDTCAPCRMIEPRFKELAEVKGGQGVAFVEISMNVGMSGAIARTYSISATPSFLFFIDGKKVNFQSEYPDIQAHRLFQTSELKGINAAELKSQIDLMLFEAFPRESAIRGW